MAATFESLIKDIPMSYVVVICIFGMSMLLEIFLAKYRLIKARYGLHDTFVSLSLAVGNSAGSFIGIPVAAAVMTWLHQYRLFTIPMSAIWAWPLLIVLEDFTYYWMHRFNHERRLFWAVHVNHHSSQHFNFSTALRQPVTAELLGVCWVLWLWLPLFGFPVYAVLLQRGFNLTYQAWIHTEAIGKLPRPIEFLLNTPSHHRVHHARNPSFIDRNFGGIFMIWDRLFGTFAEEKASEPIRFGLSQNIATHNPFRILFHEYVAIYRDLKSAKSIAHAVGYVFGRTGWRPVLDQRVNEG
ncbi:MAG: sterol desaturase family protein, partial [Bdellovibrionota bacterium]